MHQIQSIVRAFIYDKGFILLAYNGDNFFLPGGHIEYGESMLKALKRELSEEIALKNAIVGNFVGIAENFWNHKNVLVHEQCFIFEISSPVLSSRQMVSSQEPHISFHWKPLSNLKNENFLPQGLDEFLMSYLASRHPQFHSFKKD